jgi:hypothetical protein
VARAVQPLHDQWCKNFHSFVVSRSVSCTIQSTRLSFPAQCHARFNSHLVQRQLGSHHVQASKRIRPTRTLTLQLLPPLPRRSPSSPSSLFELLIRLT